MPERTWRAIVDGQEADIPHREIEAGVQPVPAQGVVSAGRLRGYVRQYRGELRWLRDSGERVVLWACEHEHERPQWARYCAMRRLHRPVGVAAELVAIELQEENGAWMFRVPDLGITGGGRPSRDDALAHAAQSIRFWLGFLPEDIRACSAEERAGG